MYTRFLVFLTKILIRTLRLLGKNASALPGLIVEKLSPSFLTQVLKPVEDKIVLVTGTNGKTTSTRMTVHALRAEGRRVVTNSTGSNMTRGLISALIDDMTLFGSLKPTDWFIFEMDEAYAPHFTKGLHVHSILALNVLRDQLDRYGEIDTTAKFIEAAGLKSQNFIYNINDPLLADSARRLEAKKVNITSYGVVNKLTSNIKTEQTMYAKAKKEQIKADFLLVNSDYVDDLQQIEVRHSTEDLKSATALEGIHNGLNATAVCALLYIIEPEQYKKMFVAIKTMHAPFGRGEKLRLNNKNITVALVKNPSGFANNLQTFVKEKSAEHILFVVNDRFADGRDVSWLWDVQFKGIVPSNTAISCSGIRAYDMAVRLKQDGFYAYVQTDVKQAIADIMQKSSKDITVIPTYTALYEVRAALSKYGKVPRIW